jgi:hypothetical protein
MISDPSQWVKSPRAKPGLDLEPCSPPSLVKTRDKIEKRRAVGGREGGKPVGQAGIVQVGGPECNNGDPDEYR